MNEKIYKLLCKSNQGNYTELTEIISILNIVMDECIVYKNMSIDSKISVTYSNSLYFSNSFKIFKNYYLKSLNLEICEERILNKDFHTISIDFKL